MKTINHKNKNVSAFRGSERLTRKKEQFNIWKIGLVKNVVTRLGENA